MDKSPTAGMKFRHVCRSRCALGFVLAILTTTVDEPVGSADIVLLLAGHGSYTTVSFDVLDRWQVSWTAKQDGVLVLVIQDDTHASTATRVSLGPP